MGDWERGTFFEMRGLGRCLEMGRTIPVTNYAFITNSQ